LFGGARMKQKGGAEVELPLEKEFKEVNPAWLEWDAAGRQGKAPKKAKTITLRCVTDSPIPVAHTTDTGLPSVNSQTLRALCGKPGAAAAQLAKVQEHANDEGAQAEALQQAAAALGNLGAYKAFGGGEKGLRACAAIDALCESVAIEKLLSGFIVPLQALPAVGPAPAHPTPHAAW